MTFLTIPEGSVSHFLVVIHEAAGLSTGVLPDRTVRGTATRDRSAGSQPETVGSGPYRLFKRDGTAYLLCHLVWIQGVDDGISQSMPLDHDLCLVLGFGGKGDHLGPKLLQSAKTKLKIG